MVIEQPSESDPANGWEAEARHFIATRSPIGASTVRSWARRLPAGASVLELGCGSGFPIAQALVDEGLHEHGIDASPSMVAAFRRRFPHAPVACEAAETSEYFNRTFDGIVAVGLIFLLRPEVQRAVIHRAAAALEPGGRFLFTAPWQVHTWQDLTTGRTSVSLGADEYRRTLADAGLQVTDEYVDEGGNQYYDAVRRALVRRVLVRRAPGGSGEPGRARA